jgi:hypothetical protein
MTVTLPMARMRGVLTLFGKTPTSVRERPSSPEHEAIVEGVRAADIALARSRSSAFFELFVGTRQSALTDPKLEALRAYAELLRVLRPPGRAVPPSSLMAAGFTIRQIAHFDTVILRLSAR